MSNLFKLKHEIKNKEKTLKKERLLKMCCTDGHD
jgi:hypothetical protein